MTDCTAELRTLKAQYSVLESKLEQLLSAFAALSKRIGQGEQFVSASTDPKSTIGHMGEAASTAGEAVRNTIGPTFEETLDNVTSGVKDTAGEIGDTLSGTFGDARETVGDFQDRFGYMFEDAKETTGNLAETLRRGFDKTTETVGDMLESAKSTLAGEEGEEEGEEEKEDIFGGKKKKTRRAKPRKPKKKTRKAKKGRGKRR